MKTNSIKICVSGGVADARFGEYAYERAKELGKEMSRQKATLLVGAVSGFSHYSAIGAKELGGNVIGFSPAKNETEHIHAYKMPINNMDLIIYTGLGMAGSNLMLTRSADAVIVGCGGLGSINEFTTAIEDDKIVGVLEGPWETDEIIKMILEKGNRKGVRVVFGKDPTKLVKDIVKMIVESK